MRIPIGAAMALLMSLAMTGAANAQEALKPVQHWGGLINDAAKISAAPRSKVAWAGYLTNQDAFEKLFDAWALKEKPPKIDFKKKIVFVQTCNGPNLPQAFYKLDADGKLTADNKHTLKGGPSFGYSIDVLDRKGIKSYLGKPLE